MFKAEFKWIFDRTKIERDMFRKQRRVLFRIGGYGRSVMRSLFRSSKKVSSVGNPPRSHGRKTLRNNTLFGVHFPTMSAFVGPRLLPGQSDNVQSSMPAPGRLDRGGSATIKNKKGVRNRARYRPRPFTRRAMAKTAPKLAEFMAR